MIKARTYCLQKSAFEEVTSMVTGIWPVAAIAAGADAIMLDPKIRDPSVIHQFA